MSTADEPWTIGRLLAWTIEYLRQQHADNPRLDAEVLLAAARDCRRIDLYAAYGEEAPEPLRTKFREFVRRRAQGEPVAYIVGHKEFYSLEFEVTKDVLIPRSETESLVVALLDQVKARGQNDASLDVADVGTGSGILAVCIAKYVETAKVTAIDVSPAALAVAKRNSEKHGVANRVTFFESDLFAAVPTDATFDFVISNPPYVSTAEMAELPIDVRNHEPHLALAAGEHGTEVIARLFEQTADRLRPGGVVICEISPMIATAVESLVRNQGTFNLLPTLRDPSGHARVIQAARL